MERREALQFLDPEATIEVESANENTGLILNASRRLLLHGGSRFTIADVVRATGLSRATIYNYFGSRNDLLQHVVRWAVDSYLDGIANAMADRETFLAQIEEAIVFTREWRITEEKVRWGGFLEDAERALLFTRDASLPLQEGIRTFVPFVKEAQSKGEIREDINVEHAAEWLARIVIVFAAVPGVGFDQSDMESVRRFVRPFLLDGMR